MLAVVAMILAEKTDRDGRMAMSENAARQTEALTVDAGSATDARKVYPYSIIEGGAATVDELKDAIANDPVVAEHFKNFDLSKTRVETLAQTKIAHVSYRTGNDVFWTRKPVAIPAGETVLTDGTNYARTRCGNCLSTAPAGPVSDAEPAPHVLDTPGPAPAFHRAGLPPGGSAAPFPRSVGPIGPRAGNPTGSSPRATTGARPIPSGGSRTSGPSSGPAGRAPSAPGLQAPVDNGTEAPGGPTDVIETFGPGSAGNPGDPGNPGNSGNPGKPGDPQAPPNGPPTPPGNPGLPPNNPIVPPPFVPPTGGDPFDPPGNPFDPPGDPFDPPGDPFDPTGGPFDPPGGPFVPPGGPFNPPGGPFNPPGDSIPPGDPGAPGIHIETPEPQSIPEPGTTALILLGIGFAARRLRRR